MVDEMEIKIPHINDDVNATTDESLIINTSTLEVLTMKHIKQDFHPHIFAAFLRLDGKHIKCRYSMSEEHILSISKETLIREVSRSFAETIAEQSPHDISVNILSILLTKWVKGCLHSLSHLEAEPVPNHPSLYTIAGTLPSANADVWCPLCKEGLAPYDGSLWKVRSTLVDTVMHLNDRHKVNRDYIADWIDELHGKGIINAEFESWNEDGSTGEEVPTTPVKYGVDGAESKVQWKDEAGEWKDVGYLLNADSLSLGLFSVYDDKISVKPSPEDMDALKAAYLAAFNVAESEAFKIIKGDSNE